MDYAFWCLIGFIFGFMFCVCAVTARESQAAKSGVAKIDGKLYRLTKVD